MIDANNMITLATRVLMVVLVIRLLLTAIRRLLAPRHYDRILVSIPYSHYVESARWAMERRGLRIWEVKVPVGPHAMVVATYRLLFANGLHSHSSFPGQGFRDSWIPTMTSATLRRLAGVPVVVNTQTETCLPDSWSVLEDCQWPIRDERLKERWDTDFGPSVRQAGYYYIFQRKELYRQVQSCHAIWMVLFDVLEYTLHLTSFMKRMMSMTPEQVRLAERRIQHEFELISEILEQHEYLGDGTGSDTLGGADIAFCALSGWFLLPENFHGGHVHLPDRSALPKDYKALMDRLESTKAAQHVRRCYKMQRFQVVKDEPKTS